MACSNEKVSWRYTWKHDVCLYSFTCSWLPFLLPMRVRQILSSSMMKGIMLVGLTLWASQSHRLIWQRERPCGLSSLKSLGCYQVAIRMVVWSFLSSGRSCFLMAKHSTTKGIMVLLYLQKIFYAVYTPKAAKVLWFWTLTALIYFWVDSMWIYRSAPFGGHYLWIFYPPNICRFCSDSFPF